MHLRYIPLLLAWLACASAPLAQTSTPAPSGTVEVAVFSINDFHSGFQRVDERGWAGAAATLHVMDSLRTAYPFHCVLSAGDNFGGSFFHQATEGALMPVFFDAMGIRISAVGNHEFDQGQEYTADGWQQLATCPAGWRLQYVAANVRQQSDGRQPAYIRPAEVVEIPLGGGRTFRVGLIGIATVQTPRQASARRLKGLDFDGRYSLVVDSTLALPGLGDSLRSCHVRYLLTHVGTTQTPDGPAWKDDGAAWMRDLPAVDGIFSAHTHEIVCGRLETCRPTPIVQGDWHGNFISGLVATVDTASMRVLTVEPRLWKVQVPAQYDEKGARLQATVDSLLVHTAYCGHPIGQTLTTARRDLSASRSDMYTLTPMGKLLTQAYAAAFREVAGENCPEAVVAISHYFTLRAGFAKGPVSVIDVGEAQPFANELAAYRMTYDQLCTLLICGYTNRQFGRLQYDSLDVEYQPDGTPTRILYTAPSGEVRTLHPGDSIIVVADAYLASGGDNYPASLFQQAEKVDCKPMRNSTDAFIHYLSQRECIE